MLSLILVASIAAFGSLQDLPSCPLPYGLSQTIAPPVQKPPPIFATKREKLWLSFPDELASKMRFESYQDIDLAFAKGELVEVFDDAQTLGVSLRTRGK